MTGREESAGRSSGDGVRPRATSSDAERGDHRAVVGAQPGPRAPAPGCRLAAARSSAIARSREFAATPPPIRMSSMPSADGGVDRLAGQHVADRLLEATRPRRRPAPAPRRARGPRPSGPPRSSARRTRSRSGAARGRAATVSPRGKAMDAASPSRAARSMCGPPGNGSPSSRATLSKASPAASSMVAPSGSTPGGHVVDPQQRRSARRETSSARHGSGSGPCSSWSTATCAARWLTP